MYNTCLLYTSDAADDRISVDLGGRRIIKKKIKNLRVGGGLAISLELLDNLPEASLTLWVPEVQFPKGGAHSLAPWQMPRQDSYSTG